MQQDFQKILSDSNYVFIRKGILLFIGYIFFYIIFVFALAVIVADFFSDKHLSFSAGIPDFIIKPIIFVTILIPLSQVSQNALWAIVVKSSKIINNNKESFNFLLKLLWLNFCGLLFYIIIKIFSVFLFKNTISPSVLYSDICFTPSIFLILYGYLTSRFYYKESIFWGVPPLIFSKIIDDYSESNVLLTGTFSKIFSILFLLTFYTILIMCGVFILSLIFKTASSLLFLFFDNLITIFFASFLSVLYLALAGYSPVRRNF